MEASIALTPNPMSSHVARNFVGGALERWGREDLVENALLLTSEVVTNAILHARTDLVVTASLDGNRARVAVRDEEVNPPRRRQPRPDSENGRGLVLVEALAGSWGVIPHGSGKVVWFEL
jgi:anti-sigma regulatory factor (Ser/Thr protein kinase)